MALPRFLAPDGYSHAIYHCVSRVVDRAKVFGDAEKAQFVRYMRLYENLCGVRVLTHCLMGNHFHLLVEVPRRPEVLPTNEELVSRVRAAHGNDAADSLARCFGNWREQGNGVDPKVRPLSG